MVHTHTEVEKRALPGVSNLLAPLGGTTRRVVFGHTLNALQHIITHTNLIMF